MKKIRFLPHKGEDTAEHLSIRTPRELGRRRARDLGALPLKETENVEGKRKVDGTAGARVSIGSKRDCYRVAQK